MSERDEMEPYEDDFNGNAILVIPTGKDKKTGKIWNLTIGRVKAKAILHHLDRIKEFANTEETPF